MTKAEKMFKNLGYYKEEIKYENELEHYSKMEDLIGEVAYKDIVFDLKMKDIYLLNESRFTDEWVKEHRKTNFNLTLNELRAINEKCKELGWLDD